MMWIDLRLGNLDLGLQSKESIGELFSLWSISSYLPCRPFKLTSKGRFNNLNTLAPLIRRILRTDNLPANY